jgi:hypothetical protein
MKFNNKKTLTPSQTQSIMKVFALQFVQIRSFGRLLKKINWG